MLTQFFVKIIYQLFYFVGGILYATILLTIGYLFGRSNVTIQTFLSSKDAFLRSFQVYDQNSETTGSSSTAASYSISEEVYKSSWLQISPSNAQQKVLSSNSSIATGSSSVQSNKTNSQSSGIDSSSLKSNINSSSESLSVQYKPSKSNVKISSHLERYFVVLKNQNLFIYPNEQQTDCLAALCLEECQIELEDHDGMLRNDELFSCAFPVKISCDSGTLFGPYSAFNLHFESGLVKEDWFYSLRKATHMSSVIVMREMDKWNSMTKGYFDSLKKKTFVACKKKLVGFSAVTVENEEEKNCEETLQVLNLLVGRIFFNIFDSGHIEREIVSRFKRKLELAPLPVFLSDFSISAIAICKQPPLLNHMQLHRCTDMGDLSLFAGVVLDSELSVSVKGKVLSEHVPLVGMFSSFELPIEVKVCIRRIEGKALISIRRPPSDRLWFGFVEKPIVELDLEPIVASCAISISVILDFIRTRAIDAIYSALVYPSMEDVLVIPPYESASFPLVKDCLNPYGINNRKEENVSEIIPNSKYKRDGGIDKDSECKNYSDLKRDSESTGTSLSQVPSKEIIRTASSMYIPPMPPNMNGNSTSGSSPSESECADFQSQSIDQLNDSHSVDKSNEKDLSMEDSPFGSLVNNSTDSFFSDKESIRFGFISKPKSALVKRSKKGSSLDLPLNKN